MTRKTVVPEPSDFVSCPAGPDFGQIDNPVAVAIGRQPGPIRLLYGVPGPRGFGQRHVEGMTGRMKQIQSFGFATFVDYAYYVCRAYQWITTGDRDRLIIVRPRDHYDHTVVIQLDSERRHWSITTGLPKRMQRGVKLWEKQQAGRSELSPGVVEKRPRFETLTLRKKS